MKDTEENSRQPVISIITVVLNGAETLERAINSVISQEFQDSEYIILDGGSLDGSIEIIKRYESKLAHWISEPDNGVYDAMNKAVSLSRGKWIYFLGADDQLLNGFSTVAQCLKDEKKLYYGIVFRPILNRTYDGKFSAYKLACRNICHQSIFYPRFIWNKYSYNLKYPVFADYDLNLRLFTDTDIKFQYLPTTIAIFSDEGGLSQAQVDINFERDKLLLIKDSFPFWIYILYLIRTYFLKCLAFLGLQKIVISVFHNLQSFIYIAKKHSPVTRIRN